MALLGPPAPPRVAAASDPIAAKDNASKTGNRDKARESIARLAGRPATLHNGRLTIELGHGKRHTIEGLSHPLPHTPATPSPA